jgi:hypothetical protein
MLVRDRGLRPGYLKGLRPVASCTGTALSRGFGPKSHTRNYRLSFLVVSTALPVPTVYGFRSKEGSLSGAVGIPHLPLSRLQKCKPVRAAAAAGPWKERVATGRWLSPPARYGGSLEGERR